MTTLADTQAEYRLREHLVATLESDGRLETTSPSGITVVIETGDRATTVTTASGCFQATVPHVPDAQHAATEAVRIAANILTRPINLELP